MFERRRSTSTEQATSRHIPNEKLKGSAVSAGFKSLRGRHRHRGKIAGFSNKLLAAPKVVSKLRICSIRDYRSCTSNSAHSPNERLIAQLSEQRLCLFQIGSVEALTEPAIDFFEHRACLIMMNLVARGLWPMESLLVAASDYANLLSDDNVLSRKDNARLPWERCGGCAGAWDCAAIARETAGACRGLRCRPTST
jgi:hypothetical protein